MEKYNLSDRFNQPTPNISILHFIEAHPEIDFSTPGPLVHFMERFHGKGYEERLAESLRRKPTSATVWMLNRVINGTKSIDLRRQWIETMQDAGRNPRADRNAVQRVAHFLERLSR